MIDFTIKQTVIDLLTEYPHLRDNDERLQSSIWWKLSGKESDTVKFLKMYVDKKLPNAESIRRMRQKIQEERPELRGLTWEKRHKKQEKIKQSLGYAV